MRKSEGQKIQEKEIVKQKFNRLLEMAEKFAAKHE